VCSNGEGESSVFYRQKNQPPSFLKRKGYGLLVFKSWCYAESFSGHLHSTKVIYEVEAGPSRSLPVRFNTFELSDGKLVEGENSTWPAGTMMVPWVRLLPRRKR